VLDAGCGTGYDVAALASRVSPGGLVVGLDSSEKMLAIARERLAGLDNVELKLGSVEDIAYPDASFDACFSLRTLQYLNEPLVAIRELMRVTRPGGRVVLCEGGMSVLDLPSPELTDRIVGSGWNVRHGGLGVQLKRLLIEAGLSRVIVRAGVGIDNQPGPYALALFRNAAPAAVERGDVSAEEAQVWLVQLETSIKSGAWFGADVMFVASGTVAKRQA
jgi:SAM-dependent methyltransferase